jgi:hypothetical protein
VPPWKKYQLDVKTVFFVKTAVFGNKGVRQRAAQSGDANVNFLQLLLRPRRPG